MKTDDEIKKGLEYCMGRACGTIKLDCPYEGERNCDDRLLGDARALIQRLQDDNAEKDKRIRQLEQSLSFARDLADGLKAATVKQEQELYVSVVRNRHLEADLEDMTARYKIADECAKKKGEMNEKLYAELTAVKAERDAAMKDIHKGCKTCMYHDKESWEVPCLYCCDGFSRWEWGGVQKETANE